MASKDPAGFIEEILSEIWNRKQIGRIYDAYQHNVQLHTPRGRLYGREEVIRSVTFRLAAFPNLTYTAEDLICSEGPRDTLKLAVRWTMVGENRGHSWYGPPTGRAVTFRGMSHFRVRGGRIVRQWDVDNELSVIRQLGLEPTELAAHPAPHTSFGDQMWSEVERVSGQKTPEVIAPKASQGFDVEDFLHRSRHEIWNWRLLGAIDDVYSEDAVVHGPADRTIEDREAFKAFVLALLAAFPDLEMLVDDVLWSDEGEGAYRTSTRWTLLGTHRGPGPYGPPSGKSVRVSGITNDVIHERQIVEEWSEFEEFALLRQIHTPRRGSEKGAEDVDVRERAVDARRDREALEHDRGN